MSNPISMSGWCIGCELYVRVTKRSRRGVLVSHKGAKWRFRPYGYKKTVPVCPVRSKWRYVLDKKVKLWVNRLPVILTKATLDAFKYKKERFGHWSGAATARTAIHKLRVWQVCGTNELYVGHLGVWKLVIAEGTTLRALCEVPVDRHFYIGRGPLTPKRFRCLKTVCGKIRPRYIQNHSIQLYKVPTRDELG